MLVGFGKKLSLFFCVLLLVNVVSAPCTAFWQPDRKVQFDNSLQWLSDYDESTNTQSIAVEMEFRGDAENFGVTFATPSEPEVYETDENLFGQLEDITPREPKNLGIFGFQSEAQADTSFNSKQLEVVEQKDVGDFRASVLRANSTEVLTDWLERNNYSYSEQNVEAFDYYVEKDGFHFVALKILSDEVKCLQDWSRREANILAARGDELSDREKAILADNFDSGFLDFEGTISDYNTDRCYVRGKLDPFAVDYQVDEPTLYTRIMGQNAKKPMDIELYTTGDVPYYVPGSTVKYSQRVDNVDLDEAPAAKEFMDEGDWLTRANLKMDFRLVNRDIKLRKGTPELEIGNGEDSRVVNPRLKKQGEGVLVEEEYDKLRFEQIENVNSLSPQFLSHRIKNRAESVPKDALEAMIGVIAGLPATPLVTFSLAVLFLYAPLGTVIFLAPILAGILWKWRNSAKIMLTSTIATGTIIVLTGNAPEVMAYERGSLYASTAITALAINMALMAGFTSKVSDLFENTAKIREKLGQTSYRISALILTATLTTSILTARHLGIPETVNATNTGIPAFLFLTLTPLTLAAHKKLKEN